MPNYTSNSTLSYLLAVFGGLLSDVVAGYLAPALATRLRLTVALFLLCVLLGLLNLLYQERKLYIATLRLLTFINPSTFQQLRASLLKVPEFDTVADRRALLQQAIPAPMSDQGNEAFGTVGRDETLYNQIEFEGSKDRFVTNLLNTLLQETWFVEGRRYLHSLLVVIGEQSGLDVEQGNQDLLAAVNALSPTRRQPLHSMRALLQQFVLSTTPRLRWYLAAIPVLLLLPLFCGPLVSSVWAQHAPTCPPDRTCILLADFSPTEDLTAQKVRDAVEKEVQAVIDKSGGHRFTIRRVASAQGVAEARSVAQEQRALLIIWGEVDTTLGRWTIDFTLTDLFGAGESTDIQTWRIEPRAYPPIENTITCLDCSFTKIAQDLSQQTRIIAYTAMGLLHYVQGWPNQAQLDFMTALYCAGATEASDLIMAQQPECTPVTTAPLSSSGLLYYYLGRSLQFSGNYAQSLFYLEEAHALNPADPAALVGMGLVYQRWLNHIDAPEAVGLFREALVLATKLLDKTDENERGDIYYLQGMIYELLQDYAMAENRYTEAKNAFQSAALFGSQVTPYNALVGLGRVQRIEGNHTAAQQTLETAIEIDADGPWAHLEMAKLYRETPRQADPWLKKAVRVAPTAARVFLIEANLCEEWGMATCAEEAYTKALQLRPGSGSVYDQVGAYLLGQGHYEQALPYFRQAIERQPCEPWINERIAHVFGKMAQPADAAWHYTQAIQLLHKNTSQADKNRLEEGLRLATTAADGASVQSLIPSCQAGIFR